MNTHNLFQINLFFKKKKKGLDCPSSSLVASPQAQDIFQNIIKIPSSSPKMFPSKLPPTLLSQASFNPVLSLPRLHSCMTYSFPVCQAGLYLQRPLIS